MEPAIIENDLIKTRLTVLKKCVQVAACAARLDTARTILITLNKMLIEYPEFSTVGNIRTFDRFAVMAIGKIHFGLIGDIPEKRALVDAMDYMTRGIKLICNE